MIHLFTLVLGLSLFLAVQGTALGQQTHNAFTVKVSGNGQPVIFIPGATCSGDEWNETVAHLNGKYECHVITIAGFAGTSPMPEGPYLYKVKDQLGQYIKDKKLENVILVGHSMGGFLSLWMASEMKAGLQKVLVVDAMPFFAGARNPAAADTFSERKAKATYEQFRGMDDATLKNMQLGMAKMLCADTSRWDSIAGWGVRSDKKTMAYAMEEMFSKDLQKDIATIKVPVLVLASCYGGKEYIASIKKNVVKSYNDQYKACTTCVVKVAEHPAKHFIMYDDPTWMYKEMDSFLAQ